MYYCRGIRVLIYYQATKVYRLSVLKLLWLNIVKSWVGESMIGNDITILCSSHVLPMPFYTAHCYGLKTQGRLPPHIQPFVFDSLNPSQLERFERLNSFACLGVMLRQARATLVTFSLFSLLISLFYYTSGDTIRRSLWSVWRHSSNATAYEPISVQCYDTPPSGSASAQVLNGPPSTRYRGATYLSSEVKRRLTIIQIIFVTTQAISLLGHMQVSVGSTCLHTKYAY